MTWIKSKNLSDHQLVTKAFPHKPYKHSTIHINIKDIALASISDLQTGFNKLKA